MDTQKLDKVRRTLRNLQHIATEPIEENPAQRNSAGSTGLKSAWSRASGGFSALAKHGFENLARQRIIVIGIGAIIATGVIGLSSWAYLGTDERHFPEMTTASTAVVEPTESKAVHAEPLAESAVSEAQQHISAGRIIAARRRLIDLDDKSPEAALTLARSYDPNYLRLVPNADAAADPKEAERWYRAWRDIAASKGLALETDRLDRIINAMH